MARHWEGPLNQKESTMEKTETLGRIATVEAQIKALTTERDALREYAIENGWATWTYTVRMSAPSLAWWKEHRPATWEKHAKATQVKKFTLV